jgi:hypothetical protein
MIQIYESRYGFHPCSRETLKKLRQLQVYAMHNVHQEARLERWLRKQTQNRVHNRDEMGLPIPKSERRKNPRPWAKPELHHIPDVGDAIENARMPKPSSEVVKPLRWTEDQIDEMLVQARLWYIEKCPHWKKKS